MIRLLVLLPLLTVPLCAQSSDPEEFFRLQTVLRAAISRVAPTVVTVETFGGARRVLAADPLPGAAPVGPRGRGRGRRGGEPPDDRPVGPLRTPGFLQTQGATTGLVLTSDGWILISRFALNFDPSTILVTTPDGRTFDATRIGEDTSRGVALLKIDVEGLPVPEFLPPEQISVGQWAFALGRTFGPVEPTVHMGIVSALRRQFGRAIQIDVATSPANYGGPVIDVQGRVLGIAVPLSPAGRDAGVDWYDSGIGFATTIADIGGLLEKMKQGEVLHRGWLGVFFDTADLGPGAGLVSVSGESVAYGAGLRQGDRILEVDHTPVLNGFHLQMLLNSKMAGDPAHLVMRRGDHEPAGITVFLAAMPVAERTEEKEGDLRSAFPWDGKD
jgi:S1-C subfamily serine protease